MWWLDDLVVPAVLILGLCCFVAVVRFQVRGLKRKTTRTAESLYPSFADSIRKQRKYAREHGGQWKADDPRQDALTRRLTPPPKTAARSASEPSPRSTGQEIK